jgi:LDH2 family malate/lactate/ureidoglycolate dehydrogenase
MTGEPGAQVLAVSAVRRLGERALQRAGYGPDDASCIVDHLLDGAMCGYPESLGQLVALGSKPPLSQEPVTVISESQVSIAVDGGGGPGYVAAARLTGLLIEKARTHGISVGVARNCAGTGRSSYYVERMARAGLIGLHAAAT